MFSSLRIRNFRLYMTGLTVSVAGDWMQNVAVGWLVSSSPTAAPCSASSPPPGTPPAARARRLGRLVAGRHDKRLLLRVTAIVQLVVAAVLGVLTMTHVIAIWSLTALILVAGVVAYLLLAVVGSGAVTFNAMPKTFLQITARDQMRGRVTALCSIGWQGTTALGAPVVGVLGHALGGRYALAFGGICCIAVAVPVLLARARVTAGRSIQTIGTQPYGCAGDDLSTADGAARRADDNPSSG